MPGKNTIGDIKHLLFVLNYHGLKQTDVADWIKRIRKVDGFSQPQISRLQAANQSTENHEELLTYLQELIHLLQSNDLFFEVGDPPNKLKKMEIREVIFEIKTNESNSRRRKKAFPVIWFLVGLGVFTIGTLIYFSTDSCLNHEYKKSIIVTKFQDVENDAFSTSLIASLRSRLEEKEYAVGGDKFLAFNSKNFPELAQLTFSSNTCDTSGLFASGLWERKDSLFVCYIEVVNLILRTPQLSGKERIILNNPPEIIFSLREDSEFLAEFIVAILLTYEGSFYEALKVFIKLERRLTETSDNRLKVLILFFKGVCYSLRGDIMRARLHFLEAKVLSPRLNVAVSHNMEVAGRVYQWMDSDDQRSEILVENIRLDSILESGDTKTVESRLARDEMLQKYSDEPVDILDKKKLETDKPDFDNASASGDPSSPSTPVMQADSNTNSANEPESSTKDKDKTIAIPKPRNRKLPVKCSFMGDSIEVIINGGVPPYTIQLGHPEVLIRNSIEERQKFRISRRYKYSLGIQPLIIFDSIGAKFETTTFPAPSPGWVVITQDSSYYRTIKVGNRTWLAQNSRPMDSSDHCYDNDVSMCEQYGALMSRHSASNFCSKLGPTWRLPNTKDWKSLVVEYGEIIDPPSNKNEKPLSQRSPIVRYLPSRRNEDTIPQKLFSSTMQAFSQLTRKGRSSFSAVTGGGKDDVFHSIKLKGFYWIAGGGIVEFNNEKKTIEASKNMLDLNYISCRCVRDIVVFE